MDAARWRQIERLFEQAVELPAGERAAFLESACEDPDMRREIRVTQQS